MKTRVVRRHAQDIHGQWPAVHPVLRRIYAYRGVTSPQELERSLQYLLPFNGLKGIDVAADLLATAVVEHQTIVIIGDFDADGATSSALAVKALHLFGARHASFLVPNRFRYGYGLTPEIVAVAAERAPDLIVTVDNGISSIDGVAAARSRGIPVIVTDHHLPGTALPAADAIVNPNQPGDTFASKNLAGVGVIFYVMLALRARLRERGWYASAGIAEPNMGQLLDLVALGTYADVVPLDQNNRILVDQGLKRIRAGLACPGVAALIEVAGRNAQRLCAADLGFAVGPRLNAAGRLEDMSIGIACLLSDDADDARRRAAALDALNRERREIEVQMQTQALDHIARLGLEAGRDNLPYGMCLYDPQWHQGVIGILASRIKERLHRPVICFAEASDTEIKGSARSMDGLHIRDVLDAVAARHPGLLSKFGGHAMAAGMTLLKENFQAFATAFDAEVRRRLDAQAMTGVIHSDGELCAADMRLDVAELLREGGPWGQGFPEPVFDGEFRVINQRIVGERHLKMALRPRDGSVAFDAIAFNYAAENNDNVLPNEGAAVRVAYRMDINEYRGNRNLQLVIEHLELD